MTVTTYGGGSQSVTAAIEYAADWEDLTAIKLDGKNLVVSYDEADDLAESGVEFAYLTRHNGMVMTVPVN